MKTIVIRSAQAYGVEALPVYVEVTIQPGPSRFTVFGNANSSIIEAPARIRAGLHANGYTLPREQIIVNLSPVEIAKSGTGYDLPIAIGILALTGQIPSEGLENYLFSGELTLGTGVRAARSDMAKVVLAHEMGLIPVVAEQALPIDMEGARLCRDLAQLREGVGALPAYRNGINKAAEQPKIDFADIPGHTLEKEALVIAAAGHHNALLIGPPGSGKTMLARRVPTILPPMTEEEQLKLMTIAEAAGLRLDADMRPFRAPHHTISLAGLIGGGKPIMPGEVTLAHGGVLFLDELQEFGSAQLDSLRTVVRSNGEVSITRADGMVTMPADPLIIAAAPPCPCGHLGDTRADCYDSAEAVMRYQERLGGHLASSFDLKVDCHAMTAREYLETSEKECMSSAEMRDEVMAAQEFRAWRESREDEQGPAFDEEGEKKFVAAALALSLSGGAIAFSLAVSRTVADIAGHALIGADDVVKALAFRNPAAGLAKIADIRAAKAARDLLPKTAIAEAVRKLKL